MASGGNLAKRQLVDFVPPSELGGRFDGRTLDAVIQMGAISETTASEGDLVIETNFSLSLRLLDWCTVTATLFIHASSAATYGDGAQGFTALKEAVALYAKNNHLELPRRFW